MKLVFNSQPYYIKISSNCFFLLYKVIEVYNWAISKKIKALQILKRWIFSKIYRIIYILILASSINSS